MADRLHIVVEAAWTGSTRWRRRLTLARGRMGTIWPVEPADVDLTRALVERHPGLGARALLHVACCQRRGVDRVHSYDRALSAAMPG